MESRTAGAEATDWKEVARDATVEVGAEEFLKFGGNGFGDMRWVSFLKMGAGAEKRLLSFFLNAGLGRACAVTVTEARCSVVAGGSGPFLRGGKGAFGSTAGIFGNSGTSNLTVNDGADLEVLRPDFRLDRFGRFGNV